jgi:hypothetical protein
MGKGELNPAAYRDMRADDPAAAGKRHCSHCD